MNLYKITDTDGSSWHGGSGVWPLPKGSRPGKWRKVEDDLLFCSNGLHLCRQSDLIDWLGPVIWEAEHRGELIESDNKVVAREARLTNKCNNWNSQTARLFAADCAERTLEIANDERCNATILAARQYAFGLIDDAAWAAVRAAAWATADAEFAAWATAGAAWATTTAARAAGAALAARAAWATARAAGAAGAAWAAAGAAGAAAGIAEREWQTKRLIQYLTGQVDLDEIRCKVIEQGKAIESK